MIYDNVDLLMKRIDSQIKRDGSAEMRTNYLAYATDNVAAYFLEESFHLLEDEEKAKEWHRSIRALSNMTPAAKQFSWVIPLSFKLPPVVLQMISPDAARIVGMHRVNKPSPHTNSLLMPSLTLYNIDSRKWSVKLL